MTTKPYDPTLKALVEVEPSAWPVLVGQPTGPTDIIDADIATVSGAADKVLRVGADPPYVLHLEFVAGHDVATLPCKLAVRNGLLDDRHDIGVRSVVVLLAPASDSPQLTGVFERRFPGEAAYFSFHYQVVRVWQLPPGPLLTGALPLLALAPISAVTEADLPGIIEQMGRRLSDRRGRRRAPLIWAAAYILLGLRYSPALAAQLFRGVISMRESSTYQAILEEGRAEGEVRGALAEARRILRRFGERDFGPPPARIATAIEGIEDLTRLEELLDRLQTTGSWEELLGQPAPSRRRQRRSPRPENGSES